MNEHRCDCDAGSVSRAVLSRVFKFSPAPTPPWQTGRKRTVPSRSKCVLLGLFLFHFERSPRLKSFIIKLDSNVRWLEVFVPLGGAAAVEVKSYN